MTWFEAIILGLIQGISEFLPISSSGHLEIANVLLNVKTSDNLLFAVVVHLATVFSTILVFRKDITRLLKGALMMKWNASSHYIVKILFSMIPVFIIGIFFKDEIEQLFNGNVLLVGSMLLVTGGLLMFSHFQSKGTKSVTYFSALLVGIAQAVAVLPGISRSGATISIGLILGIEKSKITRFSFLMVLLPILGISFLALIDYFDAPSIHSISFSSLILGFLASFVSGYFACRWMLSLVKKGKLTYFAIYCFVVGLIAVLYSR